MSNDNITADNTKLRLGTTLQMGKYRIVKYLASGGFGNTYLAINNFDEEVAVKEFFMKDINLRVGDTTEVSLGNVTQLPVFKEQMEKFQKEAKRMRKLRNKHIVAVNDLFDENGTTYYVMDFIDGPSLRDMVKERGKLVEQEVMGYLEQTLDALEVVHGKGVFHLDLKPANLMVDKTGLLRVIDFGASKQQKSDGGATSRSAICYSPGYAPIEQKDQEIENFGPWTDLYALGATLYNVLTGNTPPSTTKIADYRMRAFDFGDGISEKMRELIVWMMQGRRSDRPQSVADVRYFLQEGVKPKVEDEESEYGDETILNDLEPKPTPKPKPELRPKTESNPKPKPEPKPAPQSKSNPEKDNRGMMKWIVAALVAVGIIVGVIMLLPSKDQPAANPVADNVEALKKLVPDSVTNKAYKNDVLGEYLYTGPVDKDGMPNGVGKAVFIKNGQPNGKMSYTGPFVHGIFEGNDVVFYRPKGDCFKGSFKNNKYDKGVLTLVSDGSYFRGSFSNAQPESGTWYDNNGNILYDIGNSKK